MTRKLNTLFAAAVLVGITIASAVFAQEGVLGPQPLQTQGMMGQTSPDQIKRMSEMADKCNHNLMESLSGTLTGPERE